MAQPDSLKYSFNKTELDLTNTAPNSGAPLPVPPEYNYVQKYLPRLTYKDQGYQEARSPKSDLYQEGVNEKIFKQTDFDLENPLPNGGPLNVEQQRHSSGFSQPNTPQNPYLKPGDLTNEELQGLI